MSDSTAAAEATETQNEDAVNDAEKAVEESASAEATASEETASDESSPDAESAAAEEPAAEEAAAEEAKAEEEPAEAQSAEEGAEAQAEEASTAEEAAPAEEAKADEEPAEEAEAEEEPAQAESAEAASVEAASVEEGAEAQAEEAAPAEEVQAEESAAAEEAVAEEAASADEATAEEATTAEAAAEEAKAEEAKAEEAKPEEAKAEEAKAEVAKADGEASDEGEKAGEEKKAEPPMDPQHAAELAELKTAMESQTSVDGKVIGWNKGGYHVALGRVAAFCPVSMIEVGNPRNPKNYLDKTFPFRVIEVQDDGKRIVVSRAAAIKAKRAAEAAKVKEKLEPGKVMKGRVSSITDFGCFVDLGGRIEGLVHISELSRKRVEKADEVVKKGQTVEVQVLKVEKGGKRISLSMKRLEDDPWDGVAERFEKGQEFKGTIVRKADFGVFVEVEPGLEGLIHVSRLPYGKTLESDEIAEGIEVEGWVHEVERKRRRLSLSMRPVAEGNPWKDVNQKYPEGELVTGTVERVADFGAFIELEPGLTGLLPWAVLGGVGNPKRQYHAGKEVSVKVLSIDTGRKRISLGTEQSTAEGSNVDYKEYKKQQKEAPKGLNALAAALEKVKDQIPSA